MLQKLTVIWGMACFALVVSCEAVIALDAPTDAFNSLTLGGPSDPVADNQANRVDLELVGRPEAGLEAFYIGFDGYSTPATDDGDMYFRIRVSGQNGKDDGLLKGYMYVGLDITGDGALDYMIEHSGNPNQAISILRVGSSTANNSPDSVSLGASLYSESVVSFDGSNDETANSYFEKVSTIDTGLTGDGYDPYDLDGGGKKGDEDRFLTFSLGFDDLVNVIRTDAENGVIDDDYLFFDDTFAMQMLVVTSRNGNNINSDFGGIDDSTNPTDPFVDPSDPDGGSGGLTGPIDPGGDPVVPELNAYALLMGLFVLPVLMGRRRGRP